MPAPETYPTHADDAENEQTGQHSPKNAPPRGNSGNHTDHRRGDDDDRNDMRKPGGEHVVPMKPNDPNGNSSKSGKKDSDSNG